MIIMDGALKRVIFSEIGLEAIKKTSDDYKAFKHQIRKVTQSTSKGAIRYKKMTKKIDSSLVNYLISVNKFNIVYSSGGGGDFKYYKNAELDKEKLLSALNEAENQIIHPIKDFNAARVISIIGDVKEMMSKKRIC